MSTSPEIWGIVNVTPDSFSDGGRHGSSEAAIAHGRRMAAEGAAVLDIGGESTRPGAAPVEPAQELERVGPVIEGLARLDLGVRISVDTRRASVARRAIEIGASIVNDVSAASDPDMLPVVAELGADLVLMHMRGQPRTMQEAPEYEDVVAQVRATLQARAGAALEAGIPPSRLWVDPGIGFGKTLEHNLELLRHLEQLVGDGLPVLLGASRKSFLGRITGRDVCDRLAGSLACVARAREAGVAAIRVHEVRETFDLLRVIEAVSSGANGADLKA